MKLTVTCLLAVLLSSSGLALAQPARPACALMAAVDLKPLLGAGHTAPAPYADTGCIAKSTTPGRLVMLMAVEKPNAELKKGLAADKKNLSSKEFAAISTVAAAPAFGPEAFSAREKGEQSAAEIHAMKGTHAIAITLNWSKGPITDPIFKQFGDLTAAVLGKLP